MTEPAARVATWVKALVRADRAGLDALKADGPSPTAEAETVSRILLAMFDLVVPRWFTPGTPVRDITVQMLAVRATVGAKAAEPVIVLEMVVRRALGEAVPLDDLDPAVLVKAKIGVVAQYAHSAGLLDDELDELVAEAARTLTEP
ncbi:hypothetical protein GCM10029964_042600 [Kibdelosporangium lantanae]